MPVQLPQTDTLQSRRTDDVFELHTGVGSTQSRFDMLAHTSAIKSTIFNNVFRHFEVVRPLEIANEERALRFQDAADFPEHRNGIIKTMKRRIGNDEISYAVFCLKKKKRKPDRVRAPSDSHCHRAGGHQA